VLTRLLLAWRVLRGLSVVSTDPAPACARCGELAADRDYWRAREERTADALLQSKGIVTLVASPPRAKPTDAGALFRGMAMSVIDTTKSQQPGQGAMTDGARTT